ncbi:MAG: RNA-binding protein [Saprospiraceae bacterium]
MVKGRIFITHLNFATSYELLKDTLEYENYLSVEDCKIIIDEQGNSRGVAIVTVSLSYPSGHERSELAHEIQHLDGQKIDGSVIHVRALHLEDNTRHLWDSNHYSTGRSRSDYRDYNHFREEHHSRFGNHW